MFGIFADSCLATLGLEWEMVNIISNVLTQQKTAFNPRYDAFLDTFMEGVSREISSMGRFTWGVYILQFLGNNFFLGPVRAICYIVVSCS